MRHEISRSTERYNIHVVFIRLMHKLSDGQKKPDILQEQPKKFPLYSHLKIF